MALELNLSTPVQSGDATTLTLTDSTGEYSAVTNTTGWGTPNTALTDIDGSTTALTIDITVTTSNDTETTYDTIDAYTYLGSAPTVTTDLVFDITPAILLESGVASGEATDPLPDGWYKVEYAVDYNLVGGTGTSDTHTIYIIVSGTVRTLIYDGLRDIPTDYTANPMYYDTKDWLVAVKPIYQKGIFDGMNTLDLVAASKTKALAMLGVLESLTS